jgi:hypothetical protein
MRQPEPRSFAPIDEGDLPADVRDFTRLFRSKPAEPQADRKLAPPAAPRAPLA